VTQQKARLYGRGRIIQLIKNELKRKGVPDRPPPITLLVGPRGSGGTVLLNSLWDECGRDSPSAHLDLAAAQSVDDVVFAAMQGLRRKILGIRTIGFPRLGLAFKALSFIDDGRGRPAFDEYLQSSYRKAKEKSTLQDLADRVATLLPSDQRVVMGITTKTLSWLYTGVNDHRNSKILKWYATNGICNGGNGYDPLWELYCWRHGQDEGTARKLEKVLCAAFLADLKSDFNDFRLLHGQRTTNCLLLLDNAAGKAADRFLELFDECRREGRRAHESPDPIVVVAVQRGRARRRVDEPIEATSDRLTTAAVGDGDHPTWWYPIRLTDLSHDDVAELTTSSALGSVQRDADFIHELTGGHPEAADRLGTLLSLFSTSPFDVRQLLESALPMSHELPNHWLIDDAGNTTIEDFLFKRAFADDLILRPDGTINVDDNPLLDAMAVCAATPDLRQGASQAALQFLGWTQVNAAEARRRLTTTMWLEEPADGGEPRLHPLARLLLRRWLARDPATWRDVHQGYVTHYASHSRDAVLLNHHNLALVESAPAAQVTAVISYLEKEYEKCSSQDWLRTLDAVTKAPNRLRTTRHPSAFVTTLAGAEEPGNRSRIIARLTVARWLHNDRTFDPDRLLARLIANEYDHLAGMNPHEGEIFFAESTKYRHIEHEWEN
jgi:hypothetical protein